MKIGILQTGHAHDALRPTHGDYGDMFERLFRGHGLSFRIYDVEGMEFPATVHDAEGWLISGSRHGAYEDHAFIPPLEAFIRDALAADVPMVGICFGHQIMAQALGGTVEKFEGGWSVGATAYEIEGETITLNAWHRDQVVRPPEGAETVGHSPFCAHAALRYGRQAYSVQPHPEFDRAFLDDMLTIRGPGLVPDTVLAASRIRQGTPLDSASIAARIARFLTERH